MHGMLLLAVLVVAYLSALAQYQAMRDQQLEEARSRQQLALRAASQVIQQGIGRLASDMSSPEHPTPDRLTTTAEWLTAIFTVNADSGWIETIDKPAPVGTPLPEIRPDDLRGLTGPAMKKIGDGNLLLLVPAPQPGRVRVSLLSGDQMLGELGGGSDRGSTERRVTALLNGDGTVIAGAAGVGRTIESVIDDDNVRIELRQLLSSNAAASAVVQTDTGASSIMAVQVIEPLPGVRWFALAWRPDEGKRINAALRPLVWQLVSGAALVITAVAIVLASTTISLYRGRRRIEELRMEMLRRDLEKARRIQLNWLPKPRRHTDQLEIAAENKAAAHISGDFYNWFDLGPDTNCPGARTALVIGDVSGHGLPAAFLMATTQLIVRNTLPRLCDPGTCLTDLNKQLASLVYNGQFVTIAVLLLDLESGNVEIASAGHSPPLLRRKGKVSEIDLDPDLVCGVDPDTQYATHRLRLEAGDTLLLYTDGAIEAHDVAGVPFGVAGLCKAFAAASTDVDSVLEQVSAAVAAHHDDEEAEDDLTLVAVRVLAIGSDRPRDTSPRESDVTQV